jgi:hypothetical protein
VTKATVVGRGTRRTSRSWVIKALTSGFGR